MFYLHTCIHTEPLPAHEALIDQTQAIALARAMADAEGWAFAEPVACELRKSGAGKPMHWTIRTNARGLGTIVRFVIDATDGRIIEKGYVPR